jgi:thioredoxin reductase (NADPH)
MEKLVILGSGPAGLTAAIYAARAGVDPLIIDGHEPGGQLTLTTDIENFPGFAEGIDGNELMANMRKQAERFGTRFQFGSVVKVSPGVGGVNGPHEIELDDKTKIQAHSIIIATGASTKWLGIPQEEKLRGRGVSSCAVCDGFFFRNKEVVVVGGGDTALEDALYLAKHASKVTLIHRRDKFRASKAMQDRVFENKKIQIIWDSGVKDILGQDLVEGVLLINFKTNETQVLKTDGVFVAIGKIPNTFMVRDVLPLDENGYITEIAHAKTKITGIFVSGDVCDPHYRQAIVAAGSGAMAGLEAERYIGSIGL